MFSYKPTKQWRFFFVKPKKRKSLKLKKRRINLTDVEHHKKYYVMMEIASGRATEAFFYS